MTFIEQIRILEQSASLCKSISDEISILVDLEVLDPEDLEHYSSRKNRLLHLYEKADKRYFRRLEKAYQ